MADIQVTLGLNDSEYRSGLTRAQQLAQSFGTTAERSLGGLDRGFTRLGGALQTINARLTSFTGLLVSAGLTAFVGRTLAAADQLSDMAAALGVSTEAILEMQSAAIASGSNIDELSGMIGRLEVSSQGAIDGSQNLQDAFRKLGIGASDIARLKPDELFNLVSQELAKIADPAQRAATKVELLGRSAMMWNPEDYNRGLANVAGTMGRTAASTEQAARVFGQFEQFANNVKNEFVALAKPVLDLVGNLEKLVGPINIARGVAYVLAGTLALIVSSALVNGIKTLVSSFQSLAITLGTSSAASQAQAQSIQTTQAAMQGFSAALAGHTQQMQVLITAETQAVIQQIALQRQYALTASALAVLASAQNAASRAQINLDTAQAAGNTQKAEKAARALAEANDRVRTATASLAEAEKAAVADTQKYIGSLQVKTVSTEGSSTALSINTTQQTLNTAAQARAIPVVTALGGAFTFLRNNLMNLLNAGLAFMTGWQIGEFLYNQFEIVRTAGKYLAGGIATIVELFTFAKEAITNTLSALNTATRVGFDGFTKNVGDGIDQAVKNSRERFRTLVKTFKEFTPYPTTIDAPEIKIPAITVPKLDTGFVATDQQKAALSNLKQQYDSILEQTRLMNDLNARTNERIRLEGQLALSSKANRESELAGFDAQTKRLQDVARIEEQILKQRTAIALLRTAEKQDKEQIAAQDRIIRGLEAQKRAIVDISGQAQEQRRRQVELANAAEMATAKFEQQRSALNGQLNLQNQLAQVGQTITRQRQLDFENQVRNEAELLIARRRSQLAAGEDVGAAERVAITEQVRKNLQGQLDLQLKLVAAEQARAQVVESLNRRFELEKNIRDAQAEIADQTLPAIQRIESQLVRAAEERARAYAQAAEIAGRPLSLEENVRQTQEAIAQARELAAVQQQAVETSRSFGYGWRTSLVEFRDAAMNTAAQVRRGFDSMVSSMNSGLANFVKTGKFNFKDFTKAVIQDLITIYLQAQMTQILMNTIGMATNLFSAGSAAAGGGNNLIPIGATTMRAIGGPVRGGNPYIVGERGPELFVPNQTGRIVPDVAAGGGQENQRASSVIYNINAVDAASFRDLIARDPEFIYQITERGRRSNGTVNTRR